MWSAAIAATCRFGMVSCAASAWCHAPLRHGVMRRFGMVSCTASAWCHAPLRHGAMHRFGMVSCECEYRKRRRDRKLPGLAVFEVALDAVERYVALAVIRILLRPTLVTSVGVHERVRASVCVSWEHVCVARARVFGSLARARRAHCIASTGKDDR